MSTRMLSKPQSIFSKTLRNPSTKRLYTTKPTRFTTANFRTTTVLGGTAAVGVTLWAGWECGFLRPTTAYALTPDDLPKTSTSITPLTRRLFLFLLSLLGLTSLLSLLVDPTTSSPFPTYLATTSNPSVRCDLIGLGVRTVSFLGLQVYVAGFYVDEDALACLKYIPEWTTFKKDKLLSATIPYHQEITTNLDLEGLRGSNLNNNKRQELRGEELMKQLIELPGEFVVRIVPTRGTDFGHLRDGFLRSVSGRIKKAEKKGEIDEKLGERLANSLADFKNLFPSGKKLSKGKEMLLIKDRDGFLKVECEGELIGVLKDRWIAREMIVAYFADQNVISQKMKESVAVGFEQLMKNPPKRHIPANGFFGSTGQQ